MESEWTVTTLGEIACQNGHGLVDGPFGSNLPASSYTEAGIPVIRGSNLAVGATRFNSDGFVFVGEDTAERLSRSLCKPNDIVFTKKGTLGQTGLVPSEGFPTYLISSNQMKLTVDLELAVPLYVYYYVSSKESIVKVIRDSESTGVPKTNLTYLKEFPIRLPSISTQKSIAHILGTLDDKIDLNRKMNTTLESMAQAMFKSWFVDFDPVIDNALSAGNPIPEPLQTKAQTRKELGDQKKSLPPDIQKLFPDAFQFNEELGWIPVGWEVEPSYDVADFINGAAFKSSHFCPKESGRPVVKIAELKNGITAQTKFTDRSLDEKYSIQDGEILFSWSGSPDTSIDTFIWSGGPGWLNQHVFKVSLHEANERSFVYCLLKFLKPVFVEIARDKQTTGLGHVTAKDMKQLDVLKPTHALLQEFDSFVKPLLARGFETLMQSCSVAKLRDTLLPKLLSGELRIPDAEKLVAEVV